MKTTSENKLVKISSALEEEKQLAFEKLKKVIKKNLPKGFEEGDYFGMTTFVVPHSKYPDGYHCKPNVPLPFISIANQKNFIAIYHMGIYASPELLNWFVEEYNNKVKGKLDMGKSCIRFKKPDQIPFDLIATLMSKITVDEWIEMYEKNYRKK